jgi:hypothetical protein
MVAGPMHCTVQFLDASATVMSVSVRVASSASLLRATKRNDRDDELHGLRLMPPKSVRKCHLRLLCDRSRESGCRGEAHGFSLRADRQQAPFRQRSRRYPLVPK